MAQSAITELAGGRAAGRRQPPSPRLRRAKEDGGQRILGTKQ
jgi:hypothetical protein